MSGGLEGGGENPSAGNHKRNPMLATMMSLKEEQHLNETTIQFVEMTNPQAANQLRAKLNVCSGKN